MSKTDVGLQIHKFNNKPNNWFQLNTLFKR